MSTLFLLPALAAIACAQTWSGPTPHDGMLLLRNGEVLSGKITQTAGQYFVSLPAGEIRLPTADVEHCCRDLEEGYRLKLAAIDPNAIQDHLDLADWCLRHRLTGYAAQELSAALALNPDHPKIPLLDRRLKLAIRPPAHKPVSTAADAPPPADVLDQLTQGLPRGAVETFTGSIQPLLLNHCATAGCHGPSSRSRFQLLRIPAGRPATRRLTQRNLHTALSLIDRAHPAESPLLTYPIRAHGDAKMPVFTNQELSKFRQLIAWVHSVAATPPSQPASVDAAPPLLQTLSNRPAPEATVEPVAVDEETVSSVTDQEPLPDENVSDMAASAAPAEVVSATAESTFVPADPYDPEIFNRRFFPVEQPAEVNTVVE